jgi:ABC-2 type transport system ATP-binding protein
MISIIGLKKEFGKQIVLKNVNITVPCNSIYGLTGNNGVGKSTLFNILGGLMKPDNGKVYINNNELLNHNKSQCNQIGCVFDIPLYIEKLTGLEFSNFVGEMYNLPKEVLKNRVTELLNFFELYEDRNKLIERYSKGMKSKMSLLTALIHSPKYLFLDEPFDGIDKKSITKIITYLKQLSESGTTILLSSHQENQIDELCNKVFILENGIIIEK